jgi:hypothetical protein
MNRTIIFLMLLAGAFFAHAGPGPDLGSGDNNEDNNIGDLVAVFSSSCEGK